MKGEAIPAFAGGGEEKQKGTGCLEYLRHTFLLHYYLHIPLPRVEGGSRSVGRPLARIG